MQYAFCYQQFASSDTWMSTVFVSTPNIVYEANCPNNKRNVERSRVKVQVTVCVVKSCQRLRICLRKKKILVFNFYKFPFSLTKKIALSRDNYFVCLGERLRWKILNILVVNVRGRLISKLLVTFRVYLRAGISKRVTVPTCRTKLRKLNVKLRLHPSMK